MKHIRKRTLEYECVCFVCEGLEVIIRGLMVFVVLCSVRDSMPNFVLDSRLEARSFE